MKKIIARSFEEMQCIWMASKVIDYKICDLNFNCEECPLDKALSKSKSNQYVFDSPHSKLQNKLMVKINDLENLSFRKSYIYFQNHIMAKHLFENTYYLGLSPLALSLLDNITDMSQCTEKSKISKGEEFFLIKGDWGQVSITSPLDFTCFGKIPSNHISLSEEKWFQLIEVSKDEIEKNSVTVSAYHNDIIEITRDLIRSEMEVANVGITMADGGVELKYLFQVIGIENYLKLLKLLFKK